LESETLCFNAHRVAKYLLSRAVRDAGYKVVLTGESADEILGGYPHFRRDMLLYNAHGGDPAAVGSFLKQLDELNPVVALHSIPGMTLVCFQSFSGL
jgi:asparagine synthase (glutamine-hydrolysing)